MQAWREGLDPNYNPRFLFWTMAIGKSPKDFDREPGEDSVRIETEHGLLPWSIPFREWIMRMWEEWANSLGYHKKGYDRAHDLALFNHTPDEFDTWLRAKVEHECGVKGVSCPT